MSKIHVSLGNSKLGKIANWSLPPLVTCSKEACRTCGSNGCYALKAWRQYKQTRKAWTENLEVVLDLPEFKKQMRAFLKGYKGKRFRIHQAGDFFSVEYLLAWFEIIEEFPHIKFLAYTKQFTVMLEWLFTDGSAFCPANLRLIASHWTGSLLPYDIQTYFPIAWLSESVEDAHSMSGYVCQGDCSKCSECWEGTTDIIFIKH